MMIVTECPLVSVIIGTFNGSKSIRRAVDSILNQTYKNLEVIVCDDASTDNTNQLLYALYGENERVKIINNKINSGLSISLNNCIECSIGEFIARMDDDDFSHPDRIEKQMDFLLSHPEYSIIGTSVNYFDEMGVWGTSKQTGERCKINIFEGHTFYHSSVVMRKRDLMTVGMYTADKLNQRGQDYDLWCKFYKAGFKGYNLPDILVDYYESKQSVKRRKFRFRLNNAIKMHLWRKKLGLPLRYEYFSCVTFAKCFVPQELIRLLHRKRFGNKEML
jgi:glycosyltransferase EpsE